MLAAIFDREIVKMNITNLWFLSLGKKKNYVFHKEKQGLKLRLK